MVKLKIINRDTGKTITVRYLPDGSFIPVVDDIIDRNVAEGCEYKVIQRKVIVKDQDEPIMEYFALDRITLIVIPYEG